MWNLKDYLVIRNNDVEFKFRQDSNFFWLSGINKPNYSISDYILDKSQGQVDYVGCFAVSAGFGADDFSKEYEDNYI